MARWAAMLGLCLISMLLVPNLAYIVLPATPDVNDEGNNFECPMCKLLVAHLKTDMEDPQMQQQLLAKANELCHALEGDLQTKCLESVLLYAPIVFSMVKDVDPEGVCEAAQVCDEPGLAGAQDSLPLTHDAVRGLAADAHARLGEDNCDTCKLVVLEAAGILRNPDIQKEILEYARDACKSFQDYRQQCEQDIDAYGPLAFMLLLQYMVPDTLCQQMGFCTPSSAGQILSA